MNSKYIDLDKYNIKFKQLISGPAPVGRILNYLVMTGKKELKHKNGNRDLNLSDNIASAWCSEFMVGLGLVYYEDDGSNNIFPLILTENGKILFDLIKNFPKFDESEDPSECKRVLKTLDKRAYLTFFEIFKSSPVCLNLCKYIENKNANKFLNSTFKDDYYETFKILYDGGNYNRNSRTTTGDNRVPSLIQLCQFFECACFSDDKKFIIFDHQKLCENKAKAKFIDLDKKTINKLESEVCKIEITVSDLVAKYGYDGNVIREVLVRNSSVQRIFKNNLIAKYGCKCAICNIKIEATLNASHIFESGKSNVIQKADCENGLLLCALHDNLFDKHLITFDCETGQLICADEVEEVLADYNLSKDIKLEDRFMTTERKKYLAEHNKAFYDKSKKK